MARTTAKSDPPADMPAATPPASWNDLIGHDRVKQSFRQAIAAGKLTGSLMLVGPAGVGKHAAARLLALTLLCSRRPAGEMDPCGCCPDCVQVIAGSHPDLIELRKPDDKATIPLELLIGPPEARMQEGFCRDIRLRPFHGRHRVAILVDADYLNEEGANCLLKTLEEPPAGALILLLSVSEQRQLPTIRSRCRIVRFAPPSGPHAAQLLRTRHGVTAEDDTIARAVELAAGDMQVAARMLMQSDDQWRGGFLSLLSAEPIDPVAIARSLNTRTEQAGKEASRRRDSLRDSFSLAIQHFRGVVRRDAANHRVDAVQLARLDRSVRAIREVDRSANQSTLVECYASDLAAGITGDRGEIG